MSDFDENIAELRNEVEQSRQRQFDPESASESDPLLQPSTAPSSHSSRNINTTTPSPDRAPPSPFQRPTTTTTMAPLLFTLSTIYGASAVALGAFGAHGLKKRISDPARIANWSTASQYQLIHSVALLATSLALPQRANRVPGALWVAGMTMFSGSIYLLVLDPQRFKALGPVTPLGGLCLIGGWVALGVVGRRFVPLR